MNSLTIFNNPEFGDIRSFLIDNEPWFVGKDLAVALGYKNPRQGIASNVDDEDRGVHPVDSPSGVQNMTVVNESGMYALIFGSKLQNAKKFKHWVTSEVLPALRKTGAFPLQEKESYLALPKDYPSALRALADSYEENEKLKIENHKLKTYVDTILESKEALTMTQIAKDYDMTPQQANKIAHEEGIQYKVNGQWVLYREHMGKGYTTSETFCGEKNGEVYTKVYTKWTQKGRLKLHETFTKRGIFPHMDKENMAN